MKYLVMSELEGENLTNALQTWTEDKRYHVNENFISRRGFVPSRGVIIADGLNESLSVNLEKHLAAHEIECAVVRDSFFGPFMGLMRLRN